MALPTTQSVSDNFRSLRAWIPPSASIEQENERKMRANASSSQKPEQASVAARFEDNNPDTTNSTAATGSPNEEFSSSHKVTPTVPSKPWQPAPRGTDEWREQEIAAWRLLHINGTREGREGAKAHIQKYETENGDPCHNKTVHERMAGTRRSPRSKKPSARRRTTEDLYSVSPQAKKPARGRAGAAKRKTNSRTNFGMDGTTDPVSLSPSGSSATEHHLWTGVQRNVPVDGMLSTPGADMQPLSGSASLQNDSAVPPQAPGQSLQVFLGPDGERQIAFPPICPCSICHYLRMGNDVDSLSWMDAHVQLMAGKKIIEELIKMYFAVPAHIADQIHSDPPPCGWGEHIDEDGNTWRGWNMPLDTAATLQSTRRPGTPNRPTPEPFTDAEEDIERPRKKKAFGTARPSRRKRSEDKQ